MRRQKRPLHMAQVNAMLRRCADPHCKCAGTFVERRKVLVSDRPTRAASPQGPGCFSDGESIPSQPPILPRAFGRPDRGMERAVTMIVTDCRDDVPPPVVRQ